jgi:hypothetical protein
MTIEPTQELLEELRRDERAEYAKEEREEREAAEYVCNDGESRFFYIH